MGAIKEILNYLGADTIRTLIGVLLGGCISIAATGFFEWRRNKRNEIVRVREKREQSYVPILKILDVYFYHTIVLFKSSYEEIIFDNNLSEEFKKIRLDCVNNILNHMADISLYGSDNVQKLIIEFIELLADENNIVQIGNEYMNIKHTMENEIYTRKEIKKYEKELNKVINKLK